MDESDRHALTQMLRYSESAIRLLGARDDASVAADERTFFAVSYAVQTIGEVANRVPAETRDRLSGIPWRNIVGMRHHLVHGYEDVRPDILVKTVREDLPPLATELRRALEEDA